MFHGFIYTEIRNRESKMYAISGAKVSDVGLSQSWLAISGFLLFISLIINILFYFNTKIIYSNPFRNGDFEPIPLILSLGLPLFITSILLNTEIKGYKTYNFILAWLKPKYIYNQKLEKTKYENYKVKGFIENINIY